MANLNTIVNESHLARQIQMTIHVRRPAGYRLRYWCFLGLMKLAVLISPSGGVTIEQDEQLLPQK